MIISNRWLSAKWDWAIGRGLSAATAIFPWRLAYLLDWRSAPGIVHPDFLIIGAQKAGTTWLYKNLCQHPDIYMPEKKELHYFNVNFFRSFHWYSQFFEAGIGRTKGEATPAYSILSINRIKYIYKLMPDIKVILLLRNPIDRAWSRARMTLLTGKNAGRNIEDVHDSEFISNFSNYPSVARGSYTQILDNWLSVLPEEQIFVGFFEDIIDSPKQLLVEIFDFIGVNTDLDWESLPFNQVIFSGPSAPIPDRFYRYLSELYDGEIEQLYQRFGEKVAHWRQS